MCGVSGGGAIQLPPRGPKRRSIRAVSLHETFFPTEACRHRRLPVQEDLSEGSVLFKELTAPLYISPLAVARLAAVSPMHLQLKRSASEGLHDMTRQRQSVPQL